MDNNRSLLTRQLALVAGGLTLACLASCSNSGPGTAGATGTSTAGGATGGSGTGGSDGASTTDGGDEIKVLNLSIRSAGPGSLDPIKGSTVYDNQACSYVYETLLQYKYLARPLALEPLLLEEMPTASEDNLRYSFKLRKGIMFHHDACFEGGVGREMVAADVIYSLRRMADKDTDPKSWWLFEKTIEGFDEYREVQNEAETFDYDVAVAGFKIIDDHNFQIVLKQPVVRFLYILAMFQTSVVPREAVEKYGSEFSRHPVGTGPFTMAPDAWVPSQRMTFFKNPNYHEDYYPTEFEAGDEEKGLTKAAGQRLPIVDQVIVNMFVQDQPMWLEFESGHLDYAQIPAENFEQSINKRKKTLKKKYADRGIAYEPVFLLDFIFRGFNMEDELLGGYEEKDIKLRAAISLAVDLHEFNDTFYNKQNIVYDGMIPKGLDGHPKEGESPNPYAGPDLERAKQLLAEAGYPGGEGLPTIDYYTSLAANSAEQAELMQRQLGEIGIKLNTRLLEFPQLIETINTKKAPFFSFAWSSDYPDGENNLALFYGPNESPGSNHYNYKNAEYDKLYEQILTMQPSAERTAIYEKMRDMVMDDVAYIGSMARTRNYLIHPWLKNFKPTEDFYNWPKYLDVDESARR